IAGSSPQTGCGRVRSEGITATAVQSWVSDDVQAIDLVRPRCCPGGRLRAVDEREDAVRERA
ncbi:MAG: hypothetical protein ACXVHQ_42325, partial [Solirubrobacteraceae bacterium]